MEQHASSETWQVEVGGLVYDALFSELGEWIGDGALQPGDKVRKGNLRWIEARMVPTLVPFFNAKARGDLLTLVVSRTKTESETKIDPEDAELGTKPITATLPTFTEIGYEGTLASSGTVSGVPNTSPYPNRCAYHREIDAAYHCGGCSSGFCKICPKSYGGTVKICPDCGALCKPVNEVQAEQSRASQISSAIGEGFGFSDLLRAVAFPFRFKTSLFFGSIMFAIFSISQSATAIGGMAMFASAIVCFMLANTLTFGVLANTVTKFSQGDLESNFMPSFDDFSTWDDVVHPFFLSLGVYVSSFGPFLITLLIGAYLVFSSATAQMNSFQSEVEKLPGTHYYQGRETVEQSQQVKRVLGDITEQHDRQIGQYNDAATGNSNAVSTVPTPDGAEQLWQEAQDNRRKELEAAFGKTQETKDREFSDFTTSLFRLAAPLVVIGAIALLWGMFFFPAACAVAGYTRSFAATINPLVGLDTIKRLGPDYLKILAMCLVILAFSVFFRSIFGLIFAPFNLPGMGNIVAKGFSSLITFYLSVVFSCLIGYVLFKNSEKLHLMR